MYYNAWVDGTYVNSVFVFAPDGKIKMRVINVPGTFHDSTIAEYGLYEGMEEVFDRCGSRVVVDSAFCLSGKDYLLKSSQNLGTGMSTQRPLQSDSSLKMV